MEEVKWIETQNANVIGLVHFHHICYALQLQSSSTITHTISVFVQFGLDASCGLGKVAQVSVHSLQVSVVSPQLVEDVVQLHLVSLQCDWRYKAVFQSLPQYDLLVNADIRNFDINNIS